MILLSLFLFFYSVPQEAPNETAQPGGGGDDLQETSNDEGTAASDQLISRRGTTGGSTAATGGNARRRLSTVDAAATASRPAAGAPAASQPSRAGASPPATPPHSPPTERGDAATASGAAGDVNTGRSGRNPRRLTSAFGELTTRERTPSGAGGAAGGPTEDDDDVSETVVHEDMDPEEAISNVMRVLGADTAPVVFTFLLQTYMADHVSLINRVIHTTTRSFFGPVWPRYFALHSVSCFIRSTTAAVGLSACFLSCAYLSCLVFLFNSVPARIALLSPLRRRSSVWFRRWFFNTFFYFALRYVCT